MIVQDEVGSQDQSFDEVVDNGKEGQRTGEDGESQEDPDTQDPDSLF